MKSQSLESHQTPIASDANAASLFLFGLNSTIEASNKATGNEIPNIERKHIRPREGVWGNGFKKP